MGTRSITRVINSEGQHYACMYRQFDGYPSGHGQELFDFLNGMRIINGISGEKAGEAANGAGCLAAQMVDTFKTEIGGIYLKPVALTDFGQDYEYIVTVKELEWNSTERAGSVSVKVVGYRETLFDGTVEDFGKFCAEPEGDDE